LIENGDEAKAFSITRKFSLIPHFSHSLELLLHETLESEANLPDAKDLPSVIEFLRKFPQFPGLMN
jgi:hypothetical protein